MSFTLPPEDDATKRRLPELLAARRALRTHSLVPHEGPVEAEQSAAAGKTGTLRAAIFGMNDGLVSNFALIMGFVGAGQDRAVILLAGIAGLLAGAFSMGAGEYASMRVQREMLERVLHLEAHELGNDPEGEVEELANIYAKKGLDRALAHSVAESLMRDPEVALDTHAREELGIDPNEGLGSPVGAAGSSFLTFSLGALVPLIPFLFVVGQTGAVWSAILAALALFAVGASAAALTGKSWVLSGLRMLGIGAAAAAVTYAVGRLLDVTVVG